MIFEGFFFSINCFSRSSFFHPEFVFPIVLFFTRQWWGRRDARELGVPRIALGKERPGRMKVVVADGDKAAEAATNQPPRIPPIRVVLK